MLKFIKLLQKNNIKISTAEILDLYKALCLIDCDRNILKYTLQACLIKQKEDLKIFNDLFEGYFYINEQQNDFKNQFNNLLRMFDPDYKQEYNVDINNVAKNIKYNNDLDNAIPLYLQSINQSYNNDLIQKIKYKVINQNLNNIIDNSIDIQEITFDEYKKLDDTQLKLALQKLANKLLKLYVRKQKYAQTGKIVLKKTITHIINPKIIYKTKKQEKNNLIIVADISGSMTDYIYYILQMVINIVNIFNEVHIYVFMEKVKELKDFGQIQNDILNLYNKSKLGYGTDYNNVFYMLDNKNIYNKHTYMMIIGDGLNTTSQNGIEYLYSISKKVKKIYWLNPDINLNDINIKQYALYTKMKECKNLKQLITILNEVALNV